MLEGDSEREWHTTRWFHTRAVGGAHRAVRKEANSRAGGTVSSKPRRESDHGLFQFHSVEKEAAPVETRPERTFVLADFSKRRAEKRRS